MKIAFDEIGERYVTFGAADGAAEGEVCKLAGNGTVAVCAAGDDFCGVIAELRGGTAAVQLGGFCTLPYTGAAPAVGYGHLGADGAGGVSVNAAAKSYLIVEIDDVNKTVGFFL